MMIMYPPLLLVTGLIASVIATMAPSYPDPGAIWTAGKPYTILWGDDGSAPRINQSWTSFKIDFMTGSNDNQTFLTNVATGLDGSKISSYSWTAPSVDPYAAVYFFMFTNAAGQSAWTTRFGIVAKDGDALVAEPEKTQPNGQAIPWGNGHLATGATSPPISSATISSSAVPSVTSSPSAAANASVPAGQTGPGQGESGSATEAGVSTAAAVAPASSAAEPSSPYAILTAAGIFLTSLLTF